MNPELSLKKIPNYTRIYPSQTTSCLRECVAFPNNFFEKVWSTKELVSSRVLATWRFFIWGARLTVGATKIFVSTATSHHSLLPRRAEPEPNQTSDPRYRWRFFFGQPLPGSLGHPSVVAMGKTGTTLFAPPGPALDLDYRRCPVIMWSNWPVGALAH